MFLKGILSGKAQTLYSGLINVKEGVTGCEGYQTANTLLLGDDAKADMVPNLEINNNDVKCSHGATIGQVDEDELFYLMSRGLDEQSAKKTIIEGFLHPVIREIKNEAMSKRVESLVNERIATVTIE